MANLSDGVSPVSILLVDDHPTFREGLKALLRHFGELHVAAEADDERSALRQLEASPLDMMIVDINLKNASGLTLIRRARKAHSALRILVASQYEENVYGARALDAGANGYICKQDDADELIRAVLAVSRGEQFVTAHLEARLRVRERGKTSVECADIDPVEVLSERELEIFTLIGDGNSTREIAERLCLSVKTVSTHRDNIKQKIGADTNVRLVRRAVEWILTQQM